MCSWVLCGVGQVAAIVEGLAGRGKRPARAAITREELEKKRQTGLTYHPSLHQLPLHT